MKGSTFKKLTTESLKITKLQSEALKLAQIELPHYEVVFKFQVQVFYVSKVFCRESSLAKFHRISLFKSRNKSFNRFFLRRMLT